MSLHCQLSRGICPYSVGMSKKTVGGGMSWQWSMKQQIPMGICSYSVSMSQTASYGNYNTSLLCTYVHVSVSQKASHTEMCPNSVISVTESFPWEKSSYVVWLPHIWKAFHMTNVLALWVSHWKLPLGVYLYSVSISKKASHWNMYLK